MSTTDDLPDRVTPENVADLTEEQIERINERRSESLRETLEDEHGLTEDEEAALSALESGVDESTETVTVNGVDVDVRLQVPGTVENRIQRMEAIAEDRPAEARGLLAENIADMIVDGEYANPAVWKEYGRKYGSQGLMQVFERVAAPAREHAEELESEIKGFRAE